MAVFIALIFQVLFVFFAMAINIGLVVHDKINLQNAVDLAAYYGAQRQAEWLNVIAHQNYQIRQAYKLMAWRYRVLGTMGLTENPQHPIYTGDVADEPFGPAVEAVACAAYQPVWRDIAQDEDTLCKQRDLNIPPIEVPPTIAAFNPINIAYNLFARNMQNAILNTCRGYGGLNYAYVNFIKYAFRQDQYRLKQSILAIANNLAKPPAEMLDLNGDTLAVGIQQTFRKNLTWENLSSFVSEDLVILNSLEAMRPDQWLNEVRIRVNMRYRDVATSATGCQGEVKMAHQFPNNNDGRTQIQTILGITPQQADELLAQDPPATSLERLSLGFEKNPWIRAYIGVRAKTRPRQLFFPFGEPVQFEAKAYAAPFGGRIGPWVHDKWPEGSPASSGNEISTILPPLVQSSNGSIDPNQNSRLLPNYPRFPGDQLGLESKLAQFSMVGQPTMRGQLSALSGIFLQQAGQTVDFLSFDSTGALNMRKFEVAAVVPDIWDAIFYSIEPNFGKTYLPKLRTVAAAIGIPNTAIPRLDFGGRDGVNGLTDYSVSDQMRESGAVLGGGGFINSGNSNLLRPEAYWYLRDRAHLLTSWVHNDVIADFREENFPEARYAKCGEWDDQYEVKIPGSCLFDGGRTGYSVKVVSGNFLRSPGVQYGGAGQRGRLTNPPPDDW